MTDNSIPKLPDNWVEKVLTALDLAPNTETDDKGRFFLAASVVWLQAVHCRTLLDEVFADVEGWRQREPVADGQRLLDEAAGNLFDAHCTVAQYDRADLAVADGLEAQGLPTELAEAMAWVALVGPDTAISDKPPVVDEGPNVFETDFGFWPGRRFRLHREFEVVVEAKRSPDGAYTLQADDGVFWIMPTGELFFRKTGEDKVAPTFWDLDDLEPTF